MNKPSQPLFSGVLSSLCVRNQTQQNSKYLQYKTLTRLSSCAQRTLLSVGLLIMLAGTSVAQTSLTAGDIAFIGSNTDAGGTFADNATFVLLKDIDAATQIIFTDQGWSDTTGFANLAGDGNFTWTSGMPRSAGDIVTIDLSFGVLSNNAAYAIQGDQLFAIQGSIASPVFIAGLHFNVEPTGGTNPTITNDANWDGGNANNDESALPNALVNGNTAVRLTGVNGAEQDNFRFSCVTAGAAPITGTAAQIRAILHNRANWDFDNSAGFNPVVEAGCSIVIMAAGDTTPPSVTCPATPPDITAGIDGMAMIPDLVTGSSATDDVSLPGNITITQSPTVGTLVGVGVNSVTVTATDEAGNSSSCMVNVTVLEPPSTALPAGGIAFLGYNADGSDSFGFVILQDIIAGTNIKFTDCGVNNPNTINCLAGDGSFTWFAPAAMTAGSIITLPGSLFIAPIASQGDQILAYQGTMASPTFISAIHANIEPGTNDADWDGAAANNDESALPDQLTNGINTLRVHNAETEIDNWRFDCSMVQGGPAIIGSAAGIAATVNNLAFWTFNDLTAFNPTVDASCSFTVIDPPLVDLSVSSNAGSEAAATAITVTATADSAVTGNQTVDLAVTGAGITAGDFMLTNATITIPDGQITGSVTFTIVDDILVEGTETATLTINNPSLGVALGSTVSQDVTITDNDFPPVNLSVTSNAGSEAAATAITVTATASQAVMGDQTIDLGVSGTGITAGDFTLTGTTITILNGQTSGSVTFTVQDDALIEGPETATLTISNPSAGIVLGTTTTQDIAITDNDFPPVQLSVSTNSGSEDAATAITVTATASQAVIGNQTVDLGVSGTGITAGDFILTNTTITISDGQTTGSVTFTVQDDARIEGPETATLTISNPSAGIVLGTITTQDIAIADNDFPEVMLSVSANSGSEAAATAITVTATASQAVMGNQTVELGVSGTGITPGDFTLSNTTITIADGLTTGDVSFTVQDDALVEGSETATLTISNPSAGIVLGTTTTQDIDIADNDNATVTIEDVDGNEDDGPITLTATLDAAVPGGFTVDVSTADGTATTADNDYTAITGQTLTFAGTANETQTFTVTPTTDATIEADETLSVSQSNVAGTSLTGNIIISDTAVVTILNDDTDLSISKTDSVDPVIAGTSLTYTITVENTGPVTATNVVVTDNLPAGVTLVSTTGCSEDPTGTPTCSLGDIASGANAVYTITVDVDPDTTGSISNTATVASDTADPNPDNDSTTETTAVEAEADLSITKSDSADPVTAGDALTYTITVDNAGPSDAVGVTVADTLPAGVTLVSTTGCAEDPSGIPTCSLGNLATGASSSFTVAVDVDLTFAGVLTNTASVSATTTDPNSANDSATETTTVAAAVSDLALTVTNDAMPPLALGDEFQVMLNLVNNGPQDNQDVIVTAELPGGLAFVSSGAATNRGTSCATASGSTVTWDMGDLAGGDSTSCPFTVAIILTGPQTIIASAGGSIDDPTPANNTDIASTIAIEPVDVPTLNQWGLWLLLLMVLGLAGIRLRKTTA